jgi:membrane fusion protein, multidrug efflux system
MELTARVRNVGNAATSAFALLPSPNPSGNFTKITQRLEVQMELGPHENSLKPGMMVELKIDIR